MHPSEVGKTVGRTIDLANGLRREYFIHYPTRLVRSGGCIVAFHGAGSDALGMERYSGLSELADTMGWLAVYPNGTGRFSTARSWNSGGASVYAARQGIGDVAFVRELVDALEMQFSLSPDRWIAVGMSNGAAMAYRLAVELPGRFFGVMAVAGCMAREFANPSHPTAILHFHGTEDTFVPYDGSQGQGPSSHGMWSVADTIRIWVEANQAHRAVRIEEQPVRVEDGTRVRHTRYEADENKADVELFTILGGGHTWPGRPSEYVHLGRTCMNVDVNQVLGQFIANRAPTTPAENEGFD